MNKMDEYTINNNGNIVRGSDIYSTEDVVQILNLYEKMRVNSDQRQRARQILDAQSRMFPPYERE